jgi:hypothetical protein
VFLNFFSIAQIAFVFSPIGQYRILLQRTQRAQKTQSPEQELKKPINTNTDTSTKQLSGNKGSGLTQQG